MFDSALKGTRRVVLHPERCVTTCVRLPLMTHDRCVTDWRRLEQGSAWPKETKIAFSRHLSSMADGEEKQAWAGQSVYLSVQFYHAGVSCKAVFLYSICS